MAPQFNGYPLAAPRTRNFVVTYGLPVEFQSQDADAYRRARAIARTCEADLTKLEALFHCDFQAGGRNRYGIWVHVVPSQGSGGASTRGWDPDESSQIAIAGTFTPIIPPSNLSTVFDEYARMLFVAELAEVLMDFTGYGWNRRASNGEGLSIVLAAELHPAGYYQSGKGGPRVNDWLLNVARPDWVTSTESTDTNAVSYGCAALFINYLRYQLGIPLDQVITRPNCFTLAETFDSLTGRGVNFAFPAFENLIAAHIPRGSGSVAQTDNIFPLYDVDRRSVALSTSRTQISRSRAKSAEGLVVRPATVRCEAGEYEYRRTEDVNQIDATASCRGFAAANMAWSINGTPLPTRGVQAWIDVPAVVRRDDPGGTSTTLPTSTTKLTYVISDGRNRSKLSVRNTDYVGNYPLEFSVQATESGGKSPGTTTRADTMTMLEVGYEIEGRYYSDRRRCNPHFDPLGHALVALVTELKIFKETPYPDPEPFVDRLLARAEQLQRQLQLAAESEGVSTESLRRELSDPLRLAEDVAHAQRFASAAGLSIQREHEQASNGQTEQRPGS